MFTILFNPNGGIKLVIFSILAYLMLAVTGLAVWLAVKGDKKYYWVGGIAMYFFSFIAGFSIGLLTLSISFVLLALAITHRMRWVNNSWHSVATVIVAIVAWGGSVNFIDDYWFFLPIIFVCKIFGLA